MPVDSRLLISSELDQFINSSLLVGKIPLDVSEGILLVDDLLLKSNNGLLELNSFLYDCGIRSHKRSNRRIMPSAVVPAARVLFRHRASTEFILRIVERLVIVGQAFKSNAYTLLDAANLLLQLGEVLNAGSREL